MPLGPGKYGARAEAILREVGGTLCIVVVFGPDGPSFDCATSNPHQLRIVPDVLRELADSIGDTIERDIRALTSQEGRDS